MTRDTLGTLRLQSGGEPPHSKLVGGDGDGGGGLAEGVGRVEGVGGVGGGSDGNGSAAGGADSGRDDYVRGTGDLPGERDWGAGGYVGGAGGELRDARSAARWERIVVVERSDLNYFEIGG